MRSDLYYPLLKQDSGSCAWKVAPGQIECRWGLTDGDAGVLLCLREPPPDVDFSQPYVTGAVGKQSYSITIAIGQNFCTFSFAGGSIAPDAMRVATFLSSPQALWGQYMAVLEMDETGGFVATVPTLPGCITEGDNLEETLGYLKDALKGWLEVAQKEGLDVPPPDRVSIR